MAYGEKTEVSLDRSIGEIVALLRKAGADRIAQIEEPHRFTVQCFLRERMVRFQVRFPSDDEVGQMRGNRPASLAEIAASRAQRIKQRGRALMLVVKAKLESVESEVETFEEAFLANVVMSDGATLYERVREPIALEYQTGTPTVLMLGAPS